MASILHSGFLHSDFPQLLCLHQTNQQCVVVAACYAGGALVSREVLSSGTPNAGFACWDDVASFFCVIG